MSTESSGSVWSGELRPWTLRLLSIIGLLMIWTYAGSVFGEYLISSPLGVARRFFELTVDGTFAEALYATSQIIFGGLLMGIILGVPIGIILGTNEILDWMGNPFVTVFYILPPAGLVPLFIIWFGIGFTSKVILTAVFAILPIIINVREGVKNTEDEYLEVGESMGASSMQQFRNILLPGTIPYIVTGIRHGIARSIIGAIVAEIFLSAVGIGDLILQSTSLFIISTTIATLLLLAVFSLFLTLSVQRLEWWLFPWRAEDA